MTPARQRAKTILVADDDRTGRRVLSQMLRNDGFRVLEAPGGEKCLFLAMEKHIDGFLMDINMPGLSGVDLCRRLRTMDRYRGTPIICVTADEEESTLARAFDAGADDFITKPVKGVTLRARLNAHLQKNDYLIETQRVRDNLNRYISTRTQMVVEAYSATGTLPAPEECDVTVMFSDFRGFTELSQAMAPAHLFDELSRQLGMQVDTVYRNGGYIDKFGGDGIMAVFDGDEQAWKACRCALDIMDVTRREASRVDHEPLRLGIGIHAGKGLVGNIGSDEHLDYTVIGETVNLAARLCGVAEPMSIVVSDRMVELTREHSTLVFTAPRRTQIRGIRDEVAVYTLESDQGDP